MDNQSLRVLEFPHIKTFLQSLALTDSGRQAAAQVHPITDRDQIQILLDQVTELKEFLQIGNSLPLGSIHALSPIIGRANKAGEILSPGELLDVSETVRATRTLKERTGQCEPRYPRLADLLNNLEPIPELEKEIGRAIDRRGHVKDGASPELSRLRKEIGDLRQRLHEELAYILEKQASQKTLQDKLVTVRNDRLVIPLRSDAKGALDGIVHDTSHSGATCFVEPLAAVPLNNRLSQARSREREEEARILRELTDSVLARTQIIARNERWLGFIDCVHAKALLSSLLFARAPQLNQGDEIRLVRAFHPILSLQERAHKTSDLPAPLAEMVSGDNLSATDESDRIEAAVPVDLYLNKDHKTLIISGANTGGKTVTLKTLGLLGSMVQAGLHIPVAEGSEWPILASIFAEIGDEQDVRAHLSTFSARVQRLISMLEEVGDQSLVLLDEIGAGTDPAEGAALALAVLDNLRQRGSFVAVTTHYHVIKGYGMLHDGVENVSVAFDEQSGRPTYQLLYGHPGTSNALKIAADLGMPNDILEAARGYVDKDEGSAIDLIGQLTEILKRKSIEAQDLRAQRHRLERARTELAREQRKLIQSREGILAELRERGELLVAEAENELRSAIVRLQQGGMQKAVSARKRVDKIREKLNAATESHAEPVDRGVTPSEEGQWVRLRGTGASGRLLRIKDQGRRAEVQIGLKRIEADMESLEVLSGKDPPSASTCGIRVLREEPESSQQRLHLIGLRVDEALPLLDKAIDRAILDGCSEIHVVHGHGTGKLRQAVQDFLREHSVVKGFQAENQGGGGTGVTVVELKD